MPEQGFDVVLIALEGGTGEPARSALSRIAGVDDTAAERLLESLPGLVLKGIDYARAEGVVASLQLAGLDARLVPHGESLPDAALLRPRVTVPELGAMLLGMRDDALRLLRRASLRPAPPTLRPAAAQGGAAPELAAVQAASSEPGCAGGGGAEPAPLEPTAQAVAVPACEPQPAAVPRWLSWSETANQNELAAAHELPMPSIVSAAQAGTAVPSASGLGLAFGEGCDAELELAAHGAGPAKQPALATPWAADGSRVSLGFPEAFAALDIEPTRGVPGTGARPAGRSHAAPSAVGVTKPALGRTDMFDDVRGALPARTVWLLGALWLAVGLLLWTHDLLF